MDTTEIDLLDQARFGEGPHHDWFAWLRKNVPVYKHPEPDGPGFWVLTRHADISAASRNPAIFSSANERGGIVGLTVRERAMAVAGQNDGRSMPEMDAPEHSHYRRLVDKTFRPRPIAAMESSVRNIAADILDRAVKKGGVDWVEDVAAELPLQVLAEMIGVPEEDRHPLFELANVMTGFDDPENANSPEAFFQAHSGMQSYGLMLADERRRCPVDDLMGKIVAGEVDGHPVRREEIAMFFSLFFAAGSETTRNAIAHGMNAFLENPGEYEQLTEDPSLAQSATEEILRWASPLQYFGRHVTEDTEMNGVTFLGGDFVTLWYISGNRDEAVFEEPFRFNIRRAPNPHMAFGAGGAHFCLGAHLARLEIRVLLEELCQRVPRIEAMGPAIPLRSNLFNGIKHLPVWLQGAT